MEEKKKRTGKRRRFLGVLNLLDLLMLVFVVGILVALFFKGDIIGKLKNSSSESRIEFKVRTEAVRMISCLAVQKGDSLYDSENNAYLGRVTDVFYQPYERVVQLQDGTLVLSTDPDCYMLYITVQGGGSSTAEGLFVNGTRIVSPGGGLDYKTNKLASSGTVVSSNEIGRN